MIRTEIDSMPAELDEVSRRIMQLEIEENALKKEDDEASKRRLEMLEEELSKQREKMKEMKARWENEKSAIQKVQKLREDIERCGKLKILASSEQAGVYAVSTAGGRQIFITGHSEYDARTLEAEYLRDKAAGLPIHMPENYYPNNDDTQPPMVTWRSHANLLYQNWLNYFVYQTTPYDLSAIRPV